MTPHQYLPIPVLVLAIAVEPSWATDVYAGLGFAPNDKPIQAEIGLAIGARPTYEGAEDFSGFAAPLIDIHKPGAFFINGVSVNPNDGLLSGGISLLHAGFKDENGQGLRITFGPYFRAHPGREQDDDDKLSGLGDIDSSAGVGLFLNMSNELWSFQLAAAPHEVADNLDDGVLATLDIHFTALQKGKWALDTGITGSWGNDEFMQAYYGVSTSQSAASGYSVYNAEAGMKDLGVYLKGSYRYSENWFWHSQVGVWQLQGDAKDSPIVEAGSDNQFRALVGASFRF